MGEAGGAQESCEVGWNYIRIGNRLRKDEQLAVRISLIFFMGKKSKLHKDRYDVSGNVEAQYVDSAQTILVNKKGFTRLEDLQFAEEAALVRAYESLLGEIRMTTEMSCKLLAYIHEKIFGELYEWAGRWRTVNISKPGITWPPPGFIPQNMDAFERDVVKQFPASTLSDDDEFCRAVAMIQAEFLVVHPFREGNARTIKLMTDLLAAQTRRPLLKYDESEGGRSRYVHAASTAFKRDYTPMTEVIRAALARSKK